MPLLRHSVDTRLLEPPEPFRQVSARLRQMQPGEYLVMHHRRIPYPLFEFCARQSLCYAVVAVEADLEYLITVYFPSDEAQLQAEGVL